MNALTDALTLLEQYSRDDLKAREDELEAIRQAFKAFVAKVTKEACGQAVGQLKEAFDDVLDAWVELKEAAIEIEFDDDQWTAWSHEFDLLYRRALRAGVHSAVANVNVVFNRAVRNPITEDWLAKKAGKWSRETMVTFTKDIREQVGETVAQGIANGESVDQLIARVQAVSEDFTTWHAELIARMETTQAYGIGSMEAYKQTGVTHKSWHWDGNKCGHVSTDGLEDVCIHNEGLGVVPMDFMFPSAFGPVEGPPGGFNCGCDVFPEEGPAGIGPPEAPPEEPEEEKPATPPKPPAAPKPPAPAKVAPPKPLTNDYYASANLKKTMDELGELQRTKGWEHGAVIDSEGNALEAIPIRGWRRVWNEKTGRWEKGEPVYVSRAKKPKPVKYVTSRQEGQLSGRVRGQFQEGMTPEQMKAVVAQVHTHPVRPYERLCDPLFSYQDFRAAEYEAKDFVNLTRFGVRSRDFEIWAEGSNHEIQMAGKRFWGDLGGQNGEYYKFLETKMGLVHWEAGKLTREERAKFLKEMIDWLEERIPLKFKIVWRGK